jgi:hypothetical protein
LGLAALTNIFAESVAPGLSNRVSDGRWGLRECTTAESDPKPSMLMITNG